MPELEPDPIPLTREQKAERAASFGTAAAQYERYRQGPPNAAVDWVLPARVPTIVDLGAGTGALTRLLVGRADEVVGVEPDDRMREVLIESVPGVRLPSWAEASRSPCPMPVPTPCWRRPPGTGWTPSPPSLRWAESSSPAARWRRCGPGPTPKRVSLPRRGNCWPAEAPTDIDSDRRAELSASLGNQNVLDQGLEIPPDVPFGQPEQTVFTWDVALNADELIGLLGTFSWVILMEDEARDRLFETARRVLPRRTRRLRRRDGRHRLPGRGVQGAALRLSQCDRVPNMPRADGPAAGDGGRHRARAGLLAGRGRAHVHRFGRSARQPHAP